MSNKRKVRPPKPAPTGPSLKPRQGNSLVLAMVHPGQVSSYAMTGVLSTFLADLTIGAGRLVTFLQDWSSANISDSRNRLTLQFLDHPAKPDWLLWVDSDMSWLPPDVEQLLSSADKDERPIIGGLCFAGRNGALVPTLYQMGETEDGQPRTYIPEDYPADSIVKVAATGAAFLLIHRAVLEAMRDAAAEGRHGFSKVLPFFQEKEMGGVVVGEDIVFCLRAGMLGYPVHVNTAVKIGHHKSIVFDEPMYLAQKAAKEPADEL